MELLKSFFEAIVNLIKDLWGTIAYPFIAIAVLIDESRRINEDGSWGKYNARKNRRAEQENKK